MKGALVAVLAFAALAFAGEASNHGLAWQWGLALVPVLVLAFWLPPAPAAPAWTSASVALYFFSAWLAASNLWPGHAYTPAAQYHAAFLVGGYLVGRRAAASEIAAAKAAAVAFGVALAGMGLWQLGQGLARAHALFQTPATYGTVLNFFAVPAAAGLLFGRPRASRYALAVVLAAGLFAANSRGAWLAFAAGMLVVLVLARRGGAQSGPRGFARLGAVLVAGWALSIAIPALLSWLSAAMTGQATGHEQAYSPVSAEAVLSSVGRLGLYDLAFRTLSPASLVAGDGYLRFFYAMEASGQGVATYESLNTTYFVHDDYLQVLLELGVPGALALIAMVLAPLWLVWRAAPTAADDGSVKRAALAGALGAMAFQAAIDFPFYVPLCLLSYGAGVGALEVMLPAPRAERTLESGWLGSKWSRLALFAIGAWLLAAPLAAELAAKHADRQWQAAHGQSAAYWLAVAQRLQPSDWRYAWYAGQFWYAQAVAGRNVEAARLADAAFRRGHEANPREVRALVGLIRVHRGLRPLLQRPASAAQLAAWADRAVALSPSDQAALQERALVVRALGR